MKKFTWLTSLILMLFVFPATIGADDNRWLENIKPDFAVGDEYAFYFHPIYPAPSPAELEEIAEELERKKFPFDDVDIVLFCKKDTHTRAVFKKEKTGVVESYVAHEDATFKEREAMTLLTGYKTSPDNLFEEYHANAVAAFNKFNGGVINLTGVVQRITSSNDGKEGCVIFGSEKKMELGIIKCCTPLDFDHPLPLKNMKPGDKVNVAGSIGKYEDPNIYMDICMFGKGE